MRTKYKYNVSGHVYTVYLEKQKYANGRIALLLLEMDGSQVSCATCNLPEYKIQSDEIIVKTWSENEPMLNFLVNNGIVEDTGLDLPAGYCKARVCRLLV